MANTATASTHIDPLQRARYGVQFNDLDGLNTVAYNHKLTRTNIAEDPVITRDGTALKLSVRDQDGVNKYRGRQESQASSYILKLNSAGKPFKLEPLGGQYVFDLIETPNEKDSAKLARKYRHVELPHEQSLYSQESKAGSGDEALEDDEPDADNPYDYRHYLGGIPGAEEASRPPSAMSTPLRVSTPPSRPARVEACPTNNKAQSKPVRKATKTRKQAIQRVERVVSPEPLQPTPEQDARGLIIDNDGRPATKRQRLLESSKGPISLSRATSTPMRDISQAVTPAPHDVGSGYDEEDVSEENDDVEDFELPAPAAAPKAPPNRRQSVWEADEVEDLLAALDDDSEQLEQREYREALPSTQASRQSDSESEEE